jgi:hypothetical protein
MTENMAKDVARNEMQFYHIDNVEGRLRVHGSCIVSGKFAADGHGRLLQGQLGPQNWRFVQPCGADARQNACNNSRAVSISRGGYIMLWASVYPYVGAEQWIKSYNMHILIHVLYWKLHEDRVPRGTL